MRLIGLRGIEPVKRRRTVERSAWGALLAAGLLAGALPGCVGDGKITPPPPPPPPAGRPALDPTYRPSGHAAAGHVSVHLFEWRWDDIAAECENVLGPAGFHAVQI